ncbi:HRAS-like suppressor 2 [Biomphalaria pfeifferi]|uniref:HRAS-like suppressor 2 n=1 Tax=Biomphalaria pfeifferi TaxID=112525 RepID=A0AAD8FJZ0_BIOPF|nr:HRAS-like suppressor 2 [Biomphalaria pfeifferi]
MALTFFVKLHNQQVLDTLRVGDRVKFDRGLYTHWGIYAGFGQIIHLAGEDDDGIGAKFNSTNLFSIGGKLFTKAEVRIDDFWKVVGTDTAEKDNSLDTKWRAFNPQTIVRNAREKIGKIGYNIISANCEHFTNWCRYGQCKSEQVENVLTGVAVGAGIALGAFAIYALSKLANAQEEEEEEEEENY